MCAALQDNSECKSDKNLSLPAKIVIFLIKYYRSNVSYLLGSNCRFTPTCSQYGLDAVSHYGFIVGSLKTIWRILRCNPFSKGGYDPAIKLRQGDHQQ